MSLTQLELCPSYRQKVEDLFRHPQTQAVSEAHRTRSIVLNPKAVFNLLESQFLISQKSETGLYYKVGLPPIQLKTEIMQYVEGLLGDFPLNAKFVYEEAFLVVERNCRVNFVTYVLKELH